MSDPVREALLECEAYLEEMADAETDERGVRANPEWTLLPTVRRALRALEPGGPFDPAAMPADQRVKGSRPAMTERVSPERLRDIESSARYQFGASPARQHRYGDGEVMALCLDLRDCRAECERLRAALNAEGGLCPACRARDQE